MCPANLPKFTEAGAGVGDLAVCDNLYVLKKFQGHDCFHIFPDSPKHLINSLHVALCHIYTCTDIIKPE